MRRRQPSEHGQTSPLAIRLAWWAGFLATLVLVFALAQAKDAHALTLPTPAAASAPEEEPEDGLGVDGEEAWEPEEECEVFGAGEEEEEFCEEAAVEEGVPSECLLTSARATVTALPARGLLRLTVAYTARTPAAVRVGYRLRGGKGSLRLGEDRARFGRQGTFRSTERLNERQVAKVLAAHSFNVELGAINTPRSCHRFFDQKLTVRRAAAGGATWSEPAARAALRSGR